MNTTLVLQSFGRESEYRRAIFSVWSFYANSSYRVHHSTVILFTDNPSFFALYLGDLPVQYVLLTPEKIKAMRGEIDFLHRMKIVLIEEALAMAKGNLLYVDSDTFFVQDPSSFMQAVGPSTAFMHKREYAFETLKDMPMPAGKTFRAFYQLVASGRFYTPGGQITISPAMLSWNAGVIALHPAHASLLPKVYSLTDQFYVSTDNHASEQYAFSVVLQTHTDLRDCEAAVYHYWYRCEKTVVDIFLNKMITPAWAALSADVKRSGIKEWTGMLPAYIHDHIIMIRDGAIQAFHEKKYRKGFWLSMRAFCKAPFDKAFMRHFLYHTKRFLLHG